MPTDEPPDPGAREAAREASFDHVAIAVRRLTDPWPVLADVLATGSSLVTTIERARAAGGEVVAAVVALDREEGGRTAVEGALGDAPLHSLFTAADMQGG